MKQRLYSHVQRNLTILFTGIAGFIFIAMSLGYLYMSEREWHEKSRLSFLNTSNTILSNLEHQSTVRFDWLSSVSYSNDFAIAVYDNGSLFSHSELNLSDAQKKLAASALQTALSHNFSEDNDSAENSPDIFSSSEFQAWDSSSMRMSFTIADTDGCRYYANTAQFKSDSTPLHAVILYSTSSLTDQLNRQRLRFLIGGLTGLILCFLFTYFFIGKLLSPIRESQKQQTDFIAAASHELRTPLAVIRSSLSAYEKWIAQTHEPALQTHVSSPCCCKTDAKTGAVFLTTIKNESRRMSTLIDDLLLLLKTNDSARGFSMEPSEPDTLLLNVYESFLPLFKEKQIRLELTLPESAFPVFRCDCARITQLLGILLTNALSYNRTGGSVTLSLCHEPHYFIITVSDNGPGISDEAKPHIFERFYREDTSRSDKEHFGLGLCIAKEIAEAHKGRITVSDTPGGGATFTVWLRK